jgi:phosphoribosylglycinamide formyltransferase-1
MKKQRVVLFASGSGSNVRAILEAHQAGKLSACDLCGLICNKPDAGVLQHAREFEIEAAVIPSKGLKRSGHERRVLNQLDLWKPDILVLAGYMRVLTPDFIQRFPLRIINIHPSLLPAFPGVDAQQQAFDYGVKVAGCTVHFVDAGVDSGPVILQAVVEVAPDDTADSLRAKILKKEHQLFPRALDLLSRGELRVEDRRVIISE